MSAYQVEKDTIDLIVSVLVDWQKCEGASLYTYGKSPIDQELIEKSEIHGTYTTTPSSFQEADALGRELIDANIASLAARYPADSEVLCSYYAESYTWRRVLQGTASVFQAMGAIKCYRYQACEYDAWRGSFADELTQRAMDILVSKVSEGWDWTRPSKVRA